MDTAGILAEGYTPERLLQVFPVVFNPGIWLNYIVNTMRARTDADVAMMRVIPVPFNLAGPVPAVFVDAALTQAEQQMAALNGNAPGNVSADR